MTASGFIVAATSQINAVNPETSLVPWSSVGTSGAT